MDYILSIADIYAYKIKMTLDQKERISTHLGKILSILTFFILLVFTWFVGNDFIYRRNPVSYVDEKIGDTYPRINLTREFFPLAFGLSDLYGLPMRNDSLIEFKLVKNVFTRDSETFFLTLQSLTEIEIRKCKKDDFPMITLDAFNGAGLDGFYCPVNLNDIFLQGSFTSSSLDSISFTAKKCDFKNHPEKCGTKEEIDNFIAVNLLNYNVFFIENYISIGDYSKPLKPVIINKYKFFQSNNLKITNFFLQENYLKTDSAIFSTKYDDLLYGKLVEDPTDWINFDENDGTLAMFNIHSSNISQYYYRKYIKLSDILASVGGLIKVSIIFFSFIHKPFIHLEKFNLLLHSIQDENEILNYIEHKEIFKKITFARDNDNIKKSNPSIKSNKQLNENDEKICNLDKNKLNNNIYSIKKNNVIFKQGIVSNVSRDDNNNSEVAFKKIQSNNYFKDLDCFEKSIVKNNEIWNFEKKKVHNDKNNQNSLNAPNDDLNKRRKFQLENKIKTMEEKINHHQENTETIKKNESQENKSEKDLNNMVPYSIENKKSFIEIQNLKMGYCDLIKGYICNLKIFKNKKNPISNKYREFSKYETNLTSLIDYSNLIKMMIKLRIMIDGFIKQEKEINI